VDPSPRLTGGHTGYVADYQAAFIPGEEIWLAAYDAIKGGDPVDVYGNLTCRRAQPGSGRYAGVASHDALSGEQVAVVTGRIIHEGPAQGQITAGGRVMTSGLAGRQVAAAAAGARPVGVALTSAADGHQLRWMQL
jgi:Uncharacterized conserved protein (DUF2190)